LISLLATPSNGQDLDASKLQVLERSILKIKSFDSDGKLLREGAGFFVNAEGEMVTNRQVVRDAARVEIRTFDNRVYPAQTVTGVDVPTGLLRLAAGGPQGKVPFLSISTGELSPYQPVYVLNDKGTRIPTRLIEEMDLAKTQIPTLGQFYKVTAPLPLASSGDPVVNSFGELVGVLVIETIGGGQQKLIVPKERISSLKAPTAENSSFAEWNENNNLGWLFTGAGLYYKGIVLQVAEGCAQAHSVLESALEEDKNNANAWFLAGRCKANPQEAIEYYRHALRLNPDFVEAHVELGDAYINAFGVLGEETYKTAIDSYRKAMAIRPSDTDAYLRLSSASGRLSSSKVDIQTLGNITAVDRFNFGFSYGAFGRTRNSRLAMQYFEPLRYGDFGRTHNSRLAMQYFEPLRYGALPGFDPPDPYLISPQSKLALDRYEDVWAQVNGLPPAYSGTYPRPQREFLDAAVINVAPYASVDPRYYYQDRFYSAVRQQLDYVITRDLQYGTEPRVILNSASGVSDEPQLLFGRNKDVAPFNPFLAHTSSGATYSFLGREYPALSEHQKPIGLQPKSAFARDLSFLPANQNFGAVTSFLKTFETKPALTFATKKRAIMDWGFNRKFGTNKNFSAVLKFDDYLTQNLNSSKPSFTFPEIDPFLKKYSILLAMNIGPDFTGIPALKRNQDSPETLFSASWFTNEKSSETANDFDNAQDSLTVDTRYLLKVALQDTPFSHDVAGTITGQTRGPQQLPPGTEMEISYYSKELEPQRGYARFGSPQKGEARVVAFPVKATTPNIKGLEVWVEIRLKDLVIYSEKLNIPVLPQTEGDRSVAPPVRKIGGRVLNLAVPINPMVAKDYEELKKNDVKITISQQGTEPFFISVDWKGREKQAAPSGLTPKGLDELLKGVRNDLYEQLAATSALGRIKKEGSEEREIDAVTIDPQVRQQLIFQLANLGHRMYAKLFEDEDLKGVLARIKDHATKNPGTVLRVQIENAQGTTNRMLLPFGFLYDDPIYTENSGLYDAKAENFWDSRYQIELNESKSSYQKGRLCEDGPINVIAVMDTGAPAEGRSTAEEWRQEVKEQQDYLIELEAKRKIKLTFAKDEDEFLKIFKGDPSPLDLIYYYGHTSTEPKPSFTITNGSRTVFQIRDAALENQKSLRKLVKNPFVFLNSCKGAAFSGDSQDTFLNLMNDLGASGFVGTETTVRIPFAARIGQEFFKKIISYESSVPLVQVLREMKHKALSSEDGNPLIMLYSIYADPSVRTCSYK